MNQSPDDSMDEFDNEAMDDSLLADSEYETTPTLVASKISRRRIEDLMEQKRLQSQLDDDFYDMDLPEDL